MVLSLVCRVGDWQALFIHRPGRRLDGLGESQQPSVAVVPQGHADGDGPAALNVTGFAWWPLP